MWYFSCFRARGCTLWACLSAGCGRASCSGCSWSHPSRHSRVRRQLQQRLCLLTVLGRGEPLERKRWAGTAWCGQARRQRGMLCSRRAALARGVAVPAQRVLAGQFPAGSATSASLQHPAGHPQRAHRTQPSGMRAEEEFYPLAVCPSICSRVSTALWAHRVVAAAFTHHLSRGKEQEEQGYSFWGKSPTYGLQCNMP